MKRILLLLFLGIAVLAGLITDGHRVNRSWAAVVTTGAAWDLYNAGKWEKAETAFARLTRSKNPALAREALLGLGYTRLKLGRLAAAGECFSTLVRNRYKIQETLPALLDVLIQGNEFDVMDQYLPMLDAQQRQVWIGKRSDARVRHVFHDDILNQGLTLSPEMVGRHLDGLDDCAAPDVYFQIAGFLMKSGDQDMAVRILTGLLSCSHDPRFRFGILSRLGEARDAGVVMEALDKEMQQSVESQDPTVQRDLIDLYKRLLHTRLAGLPAESEERLAVARKILSLDTSDLFANTILAWHDLNSGDYRASEQRFSDLMSKKPDDPDLVLGLGYSMYHQNKLDQAAELLESSSVRDTPKIRELKGFLFQRIINDALSAGDWDTAGRFIALLEGTVEHRESLVLMKSRLATARGNPCDALVILETEFAERPSPALGKPLLDTCRECGFPDKAWVIAQAMNASGDKALVQVATQWLADHQCPIAAAQMLNAPDACHFNADSVRLETSGYHRHKDGDTGTSQLDETGLSIGLIDPYIMGRQWSITLSSSCLSSGDSSETTAGSFYRYLNGQKPLASPDSTLTVQRVALGWEAEGPVRIQACIGTSPLNGPVEVTPTLFVSGEYNRWRFDVHRTCVNDSILSAAGLEDPYGEASWGRVMKNGISVGKTLSIGDTWWFSVDTGVDAYRGKNVWENNAWHLDAATGTTFTTGNSFEVTAGLYASGMGFDHNTNFYTFGHGGYYSPDLMVAAGPFVRFRTAPCRDFWIDTQVSAGWMMEETKNSPYYPIHYEIINDFKPEAMEELHGVYPGDRENRMAYAVRAEAWKLLSNHIAFGGMVLVEQSSNSVEWRISLGMDFFFDRQNRFWKRDSLASRPGHCCH